MTVAPTDARPLLAALFVRPERPRRPPLLDVVLAAAFVALTIAEAVTVDDSTQAAKLWLLSLPALATLAFRRQYPLVVAVCVTNVNVVTINNNYLP